MKKMLILLLLFLLAGTATGGKQMAVTIDDLPFLYRRYLPDSVESEKFLSVVGVFRKHNIKVIGFVIGSRINAHYQELLDQFLSEGHLIGNHTFTHPDLNNTSIDSYKNDITQGENALSPWMGKVKYFRYPCLHQGPDKAKYQAVSEFLKAGDYINVPVSIDNDDWLYNRDFVNALKAGNQNAADSIGLAYLAHMKERTLCFDSLAVIGLHRDIKHILLIHMTELNARYLDTLLCWYENQGWQFITPWDALGDSLYQMQDTYIGRNGTSWLLRFERDENGTLIFK